MTQHRSVAVSKYMLHAWNGPTLPQVVTLQLPQDWPYTIHLLGHLFNLHLCVFCTLQQ